jgi:class 3 adenylate cyclase
MTKKFRLAFDKSLASNWLYCQLGRIISEIPKMKCPECGRRNPEAGNFCYNCGRKLRRAQTDSPQAISFNQQLEKLQRYLPRGITRKILNQKEKIEGERRQVTVMFCDMEGFTPLVDRLDTEDAYRIMDKVYEILIQSVHEVEGTVNEMTGDGIMALFGAPIALEDAPQRALRAAIAIHRRMVKFSAQNMRIGPMRMRIGIHTGLVVVGTLGNDLKVEFKAVGDTVNLASRMEKLAAPGTTYVTAETFKQTRKLFQFEILGRKVVKGRKDLVPVYKLLSAKQDVYRSRLGTERMIYSRLIGRREELARIERQLMKVINGEGSVINIIGEAGIGKSRLVAELKKREVLQRVIVLEGRAVAIGRNLGLHPIIDILRQWSRIRHDDSEPVAFSKLESALQRIFPEEWGTRLPIMAALMGLRPAGHYARPAINIEGESLKKLIQANVRELLVRTANQMPMVIITEDLHWSDTSSIELLASLFDLSKTERIVFINLFRPGFKETGERLVESLHERPSLDCVEIRLDPLDARRCETLIRNMLSHSVLEHAITDQIVNRAGGNPYFIEEIVRSMIDEGALIIKDGIFQTTTKITSIRIPNTINDVLMSRIDQLAEATRDVVLIAAIVGRTFQYRIIKDVAEGIDDLDARLSNLKGLQLISEYRETGEVAYRFKHGLAQEAVYLSMLPRKRKKLHLRVANAIESLFQDKLHEFYGVLSYHFNKGEDLEKAEEYMLIAGNEAMKISASNEALNYYKTAMELYIKKCGNAVERMKIAGLEENIAIAFFSKGNFVEAVNYFERSLKNYGVKRRKSALRLGLETMLHLLIIIKSLYIPAIFAKQPPRPADIRLMNLKFKLAMSLSYVDINRVFFDNICNVRPAFKLDIRKAPVYVDALIGLSALFAVSGISFRLSRKILDYVDNQIFHGNNRAVVPQNFYRFIEALYNCLTGNWHHPFNPEYIDDALRVGDVSHASGYLFWLGYSKLEHGDLETTRKIMAIQNDIASRYHFEHARLDFFFLGAKLAICMNALSKAKDFVDEGIVILQKYGLDSRKIEFYGLKLKILVLQNDLPYAGRILRESDDLILKIGRRAILPNYYGEYLIGKLWYCLGQLEQAIDREQQTDFKHQDMATRAAVKQNVKHFKKRTAVGRTESYRLIGRYYGLVHSRPKALKWYHKSIHEGRRLRAERELSKSLDEVEGQRNLDRIQTKK